LKSKVKRILDNFFPSMNCPNSRKSPWKLCQKRSPWKIGWLLWKFMNDVKERRSRKLA
jgi:hypothetical protein